MKTAGFASLRLKRCGKTYANTHNGGALNKMTVEPKIACMFSSLLS